MAECTAMSSCLEYIYESVNSDDKGTIRIHTDSQSLLMAMQKGPLAAHQTPTQTLFNRLYDIHRKAPNVKVSLRYVPAHTGIMENEAADRAAKEGLNSVGRLETPLWIKDCLTTIKRHLRKHRTYTEDHRARLLQGYPVTPLKNNLSRRVETQCAMYRCHLTLYFQ
eukprot:Tbor_TRINITY_DN5589_c1_g10::TRINITY_DN5589_c1_g10_i1::g.13007::m.13007